MSSVAHPSSLKRVTYRCLPTNHLVIAISRSAGMTGVRMGVGRGSGEASWPVMLWLWLLLLYTGKFMAPLLLLWRKSEMAICALVLCSGFGILVSTSTEPVWQNKTPSSSRTRDSAPCWGSNTWEVRGESLRWKSLLRRDWPFDNRESGRQVLHYM
jgi:hypothetical protein